MAEPETASPPPSTAENLPPQPPQSDPIEQEIELPINLTDSPDHSKSPSPESLPNSPPPPSLPPPQQPTTSLPVIELKNVSSSISIFQDSLNSLQFHLNSLKSAVDNLIANSNSNLPFDIFGVSPAVTDAPSNGKHSTEGMEMVSNAMGVDVVPKPDVSIEELKTNCETMNFRGLKRYLVMNMQDIDILRVEIPKALRYAPNPAKFVLECSGRFFLQGCKAYVKGSPMVTGREASVFILECFILMEGGEDEHRVDADVKEEADGAALLWKKRMIGEGGIMKACDIDARGLLLLLGCYGVPRMFKNDDVRDLMRRSNVREIAGTLRRSKVLMEKAPEIIEGMIKNNLEVEAIDITYTFGFEQRFNVQTILTSLLQKFKEPSEKVKNTFQTSPAAVNEANKKQLHVLKSLVKCLECHKIDSSTIISGWHVQEKISSLEKEISEYDKTTGAEKRQKRRVEEAEAGRRLIKHERKRSRYGGQGRHQQNVGHNSQRNILATGMAGHINGYSASQSMLHGQAAGTGYGAAGAYRDMVVDPSVHMINHGVQPYGWHADPNLTERAVTHSYAAQPSSSLSSLYRPPSSSLEGGYVMLPSGSSVAAANRGAATDPYHQFADTAVDNEYHPPGVAPNHTSYPY